MVAEDSTLPVVTVYFERIFSMLKGKISREKLVEVIPYLGLDIEEEAEDHIRIEYNPNRTDFSTDWGLARALNNFLEFQTIQGESDISESGVMLRVDRSVSNVRPYLVATVIKGIQIDDESIRQIISMQEDLHNGIGRKRKKVAIGIHDFDVISHAIEYLTEPSDFSFIPLNCSKEMSVSEILKETKVGAEYGHIVSSTDRYPIIRDSDGGVLSFPPIINGDLTKLSEQTKNLFIEITATDMRAAEDALAIVSFTFAEAGGQIESVRLNYEDKSIFTPNLIPRDVPFDLQYSNSLIGLDLTEDEAMGCLRRSGIASRVEGGKVIASIPRYRFDILHQVDVVEEVAIGYGLDRIEPSFPKSSLSGRFKKSQVTMGHIRDSLAGLGLIEVMNFSLVGEEMLAKADFDRNNPTLTVMNPKTVEHEILRSSLIPSLLSVLAKNIHESYPQKIFEISKVFVGGRDTMEERYHAAVAITHSSANFTEIKSYLDALLLQSLGLECATKPAVHGIFIDGRSATIIGRAEKIGLIGEINPKIIGKFGLRTPVVSFEVDLDVLIR